MLVRRMSCALALAGLIVGSTPSAEAASRGFVAASGPFFADSSPIFSSLRLMIEPSDADVYVSGQHVGQVADFNGLLQRLTVKPGEREVVLYREGYRTVRQTLDLQPGAEQKIRYAMQPLAEGVSAEPPPGFQPKEPVGGASKVDLEAPAVAAEMDAGAAGFGELVLNVMPRPDAVLIDGERWPFSATDDPSLLFHIGAGKRRVELRKAGYETFRTEVLVEDGKRIDLNVSLPKR